jgi:hypothetical protein
LRCKGRCFNCKRRGHVSTAYLESKEISKKTRKIVRVASATSSDTEEKKKKKKTTKARKEESSSKGELDRIETLDKNSTLGKE